MKYIKEIIITILFLSFVLVLTNSHQSCNCVENKELGQETFMIVTNKTNDTIKKDTLIIADCIADQGYIGLSEKDIEVGKRGFIKLLKDGK